MEIVITQWGLDSYLELVGERVFSRHEYLKIIRPEVMLLKEFPLHPKFSIGKFWSPANDMNGKIIGSGFKMKWHQIGAGRIQLRLPVAILHNRCFLCEAYVKQDEKTDRRKMAKFKGYIDLIKQGRYISRGKLS